jgi:hypothetical protein
MYIGGNPVSSSDRVNFRSLTLLFRQTSSHFRSLVDNAGNYSTEVFSGFDSFSFREGLLELVRTPLRCIIRGR